MYKFSLLCFLSVLIIIVTGQDQDPSFPAILSRYQSAEKIYQRAEALSATAEDDESLQKKADEVYSTALVQFISLATDARKSGSDSLLFLIHLRMAWIEYLFDSLLTAQKDFKEAILLGEKHKFSDSVLFVPYLYCGSIFYSRNEFDSALSYYKKAEQLTAFFKSRPEGIERLFNRLGVMYYEVGDYRSAQNYFEKAIEVTPGTSINLLANYRMNIASMYIKLDETEKAKDILESLFALNVFRDEINHNLGIVYLKQKKFREALGYLRKVDYVNDKKAVDLFYNKAMAMYGLEEEDSAEQYILRAKAEALKWYGKKRNTPEGLILKLEADHFATEGKFRDAAAMYQLSVVQFTPGFNDTSLLANPVDFTTVHSYINLFNVLCAKADALDKLYAADKNILTLEESLAAYRSAFQLAEHVERTYNSDEARLFIGHIKYAEHFRPIQVGLKLYNLTQKRDYLEEVYYFDQQNKASVLTLNIWEKHLISSDPTLNGYYEKETSLRSQLTRLSLKANLQTDSTQLAELDSAMRDKEIELEKIQQSIKENTAQLGGFYRQIPSINDLQRKLDNHTALLSFHLSEHEMVTMVITASTFACYQAHIDSSFYYAINLYKTSLYNVEEGKKYSGDAPAKFLYQRLLAPANTELSQMKRLIIIPDDELNYLPFEALEDENGNYLLQRYSIQYQYATSLVANTSQPHRPSRLLSFAPFSTRGYRFSDSTELSPLPASSEEINDPKAMVLTDSLATKDQFLSLSKHFRIIHLATHAEADDRDPMRSYIAFYPGAVDYKLYAREIYDLHLDSALLVILSACETANGQLVHGEGLMSLSRAFAYAGCPNIIASLWKAEDRSTAYISQRLHIYLNNNIGMDEALQKAKLDLLNNNQIDPRYKSPNYWAQLLLIGNYEPDHKRTNWPWVAIGIVTILLAYVGIKRKGPSAKEQQRA